MKEGQIGRNERGNSTKQRVLVGENKERYV